MSQHSACSPGTPPIPTPRSRHLLRILETDRYDEEAHLGLVRTLAADGRHGEAHRHYLNYRRAMDELGVEPAPFPGGRRSAAQVSGRPPAAFSQP